MAPYAGNGDRTLQDQVSRSRNIPQTLGEICKASPALYTRILRRSLQSKTRPQGSPINQGSSQEKMNFRVFRDQTLQPGSALMKLASELMIPHISEGFMKALIMTKIAVTGRSQPSDPD